MTTGLASVDFQTFRLVELMIDHSDEFAALTGPERERVRMIISCGKIDMSLGSTIRARIFELFPEGTDIYADLTEMLSFTPSEFP